MSNEFLQKKRNSENDEPENIIFDSNPNKKIKTEDIKLETTKIYPPKEITKKDQENNDIMDLVFKYNITSKNYQ